MEESLIGIRLRTGAPTEDYKIGDVEGHVGDLVLVETTGAGTTVAEVIQKLEELAPGVAFYICDERGRLRPHVNVFVAGEMIVDRRSLSDAVGPGTRVFIAQALSGG